MPVYEYHCEDCQQRVSVFYRSFSEADRNEPVCPECEGTSLKRLISRVAVLPGKSGASQHPPSASSASSEDPRTLAQIMRASSRKAGQDFGSDFKEVAARLEKGESPTSVEKSLRKRVGESLDGPVT